MSDGRLPGDEPLVDGPAGLVAGPSSTSGGIARLETVEGELAAVDRALARLDDGTYGRCQVCEAPIDDEVLAGDPLAERCSHHLGLRADSGTTTASGR